MTEMLSKAYRSINQKHLTQPRWSEKTSWRRWLKGWELNAKKNQPAIVCLGNHKKLGATREQGWSSKKWGSKADKNRIQESFECLIEEHWVYSEAMRVKGAPVWSQHPLYLSLRKSMTRVEKIVEAAKLEAGRWGGRYFSQSGERCWLPQGFPMSQEREANKFKTGR